MPPRRPKRSPRGPQEAPTGPKETFKMPPTGPPRKQIHDQLMEDGMFFKMSLFCFRRASELPSSSSCSDPILESDSVQVFPWSLGPSAKRLAFLTYVHSGFSTLLHPADPDVVIVSQRRHPQVWPPRQPPKTSDRAREPSSRPQSARGARRLPEKLPGGPQMAPNRPKDGFQNN